VKGVIFILRRRVGNTSYRLNGPQPDYDR